MPKTAKLKMQLDTMNIHIVSQSLSIQYQLKHKELCTNYLNWYRFSALCLNG